MSYSYFILFFFLSISLPLLVSSQNGFSLDLIHQHSPKSPFYNSSLTPTERSRIAFLHSMTRAMYFAASNGNIQSHVTPASGEYIISINIGTPPHNVMLIADSGSELLWTQCTPCINCYNQRSPIYDSTKSSTYKAVPYISKPCSKLEPRGRGPKNTCSYKYTYGDRPQYSTAGILSTETLSFDNHVSIPDLLFGCSNNNHGDFKPEWAGILGLDKGPLSLVSQLGPSIDYKFSYCLVPATSTGASSKLNFGSNANVGPHALVTPLVKSQHDGWYSFIFKKDTYYWLMLESISVGNEKVASVGQSFIKKGKGNIIVDLGTTLTVLDDAMLKPLMRKVSKVVKHPTTGDPSGLYSLCYKVSGGRLEAPDITFQFTGAAVKLKPLNTFIQIQKDVACFAFASSTEIAGGQVLGNLAQQNMHLGFDLKNNKLSIAPADCSRM